MEDSKLTQLLLVWLGAVFVLGLVRARQSARGTGLVLAYLVSFWLLHWVAAALYILPGYQNFDPRMVEAGLEQGVYAVLAFAVGTLVVAPVLSHSGFFPEAKHTHDPDPYLPKAYIWTGVVFYMLLSTALGRLPSATAIVSTGQELIVVGLSLCCWKAWKEDNSRMLAAWLGVALLFPLVTIITRGFIGYGAMATFSVLVFASNFVRSRLVILVGALVLGYLGLSVYVSYMRDRGEIRRAVWGGESLGKRVERVGTTATTFEWFELSNKDHLRRLDERLNQSFLVGAAVKRLSEVGGYAGGDTLWDALLALIPRVLWPDKPMVAGSGNLVSQYTGIQFDKSTSVGVGQVMEFYINFGTVGVLIGFLFMGAIITILDLQAADRLAKGDLHGFVVWYLPGISFLQVGGSLVEVTTSAAASLLVAMMANRFLDRLQKKESQEKLPTPRPLPAFRAETHNA